MLLDSLTVCAFRGIKDIVSLDLRSRITLIHSPNGLGKTSLCDAAEWLLTGDVLRLQDGFQGKERGIRNIFARDTVPLAESALHANGAEIVHVRRQGSSESTKIECLTNRKWSKISLNAFLARFTPESLPQSAEGVQALNIRRGWVRASRFLETHALQLLLDNDDQSNDVRDLVFSDLLGVGELQRRERDLRKIIALLGGTTQLAKELKQAQREANAVKKLVRQSSTKVSEPMLETFRDQIGAAVRLMKINRQPGSCESQLAAADRTCAKLELDSERRRAALTYVTKHANAYRAARNQIDGLERQQAELQRSKDKIDLADAEINVQTLNSDWSQSANAAKSLLDLPLRQLNVRLEAALTEWRKVETDDHDEPAPPFAQARLTRTRAMIAALEQRLIAVSQSLSSISLWRKARLTVSNGPARIAEFATPTAEELESTENNLKRLKNELVRFERNLHEVSQPLEQLKIASLHYLLQDSGERRCPVCGHDHDSADELRQAIQEALETLPADLNQMAQERQSLSGQIASQERRLREWSEAEQSIRMISDDVENARRILSDAAPVLQSLGIGLEDLADKQIRDSLRAMKHKVEAQMSEAVREAELQKRRLEAALQLESIRRDLESTIDCTKVLMEVRVSSIADAAPAKWLKVLKGLISETEGAAAKLQNKAAIAQVRLKEATDLLKQLRSADRDLRKSLDGIAGQLDKAKARQREFEKHWRLVAGDESWNTKKRDSLLVKCEKETEEIAGIRRDIEAARATLFAAREVESQERERVGNQLRLAKLQSRVMELQEVAKIRDECVQAADLLRTVKDASITRQIKPLCEVITALYVRAQSASFIDRIGANRDDGPMHWLAHIGDQRLEDTAQMSLGQRQDLALAIFLSRARQVGGTFFLDEPLLHLDDLNRVALLDVLRTIAVEDRPNEVRLVVTTANESLVRHCQEKFALLIGQADHPSLRVYRLVGDPQLGIEAIEG